MSHGEWLSDSRELCLCSSSDQHLRLRLPRLLTGLPAGTDARAHSSAIAVLCAQEPPSLAVPAKLILAQKQRPGRQDPQQAGNHLHEGGRCLERLSGRAHLCVSEPAAHVHPGKRNIQPLLWSLQACRGSFLHQVLRLLGIQRWPLQC